MAVFVSSPKYPDVPRAPGVPPVLRQLGAIENTAAVLIADVVSIVRMFQGPQWGIFDQAGNPVLIGDSVIAVDYRKEYRISDYPMEQGAFASYNKVQLPFDIRVVFAASGKQSLLASILSGGAVGSLITGTDPNAASRAAFLDALDQAVASLYLFTVVTPEKTYRNVNLIHYDYRRDGRSGATLIKVEVWCQEVRITTKAAFSETRQPSGTEPIDGGTTQPAAITSAQGNALPPPPGPAGSGGTVPTGEGTGTAPVIDVPIGSTPPGQVPLYQNGSYVGHVQPGTPLPSGFTIGPVQS